MLTVEKWGISSESIERCIAWNVLETIVNPKFSYIYRTESQWKSGLKASSHWLLYFALWIKHTSWAGWASDRAKKSERGRDKELCWIMLCSKWIQICSRWLFMYISFRDQPTDHKHAFCAVMTSCDCLFDVS